MMMPSAHHQTSPPSAVAVATRLMLQLVLALLAVLQGGEALQEYPGLAPYSGTRIVSWDRCEPYSNQLQTPVDGSAGNFATGSNCFSSTASGPFQSMTINLATSVDVKKVTWTYCDSPGFSDGQAKDWQIVVNGAVTTGQLAEDVGLTLHASGTTVVLLDNPGIMSSLQWNVLNNWGNGAYVWTCEITFYVVAPPPPPS
eukprot:CAMPEP_0182909280 /NCGR_PEP_ID=MMETSP0034_2-20130328/35670_1 /TAXON_ID=156128 /ORGANISM="Nephroselmis pyriformis, Strain CCMP717" /LENGTH=198 /DNA_ID=CAMNT_0025045525 /DNA_START=74 /DNA_END=666 /DNA_ORIENTATION=+